VTFAGATVDGIIGWVPRGGDMTFGVAIFSYNGAVTVGFSTDAAVIPDPETLVTAFEDEVATMSAATSQP
jgi:diacylglycerol O-acyltransferase